MKITKNMKIGDIYINPLLGDLWILRKGYPNDYDHEEWVLALVHTDYEEEYLMVKDFIKVGNIYDIVGDKVLKELKEGK